MGPERWQAIRAILDATLDLPRDRRADHLDRACAGDLALRAEVDALLAFEDGARLGPPTPTLWHAEARAALGTDPAPGACVGRFRLEALLAVGGMGEVWRARRVEGFAQLAGLEPTVAIKLIRRGVDTVEMLQRFARERALLAALQHDGIARLHDGGVDANGRPFMVMELVDGVPIDVHCRDQELSVRARIELFEQVCEAVAFAHQHLVIHRDLKPSNILVTRDGRPKLVDFGIAKVLTPDGAAPDAARTATGVRVLTPAYASPEQLRGELVTTRSDVYSLGLVLWELLVQAPAFTVDREPDSEVLRASAELGRRTGSRRLVRELAGDLDTILGRACHTDPARRYGGAAELAADLRRYLSFQPIHARRDSASYRAAKFVRRNRVLVSATGAVFLALIVATTVSTNMYLDAASAREHESEQRTLAKERFDQTRSLATGFMFDVHDDILDVPGTSKVRARILSTVADTLDSLAAGRSDDQRELDLELYEAYERLATTIETAGRAGGYDIDVDHVLARAQAIVDRTESDPDLHAQLVARLAFRRGSLGFHASERELAAVHFAACLDALAALPVETRWRDGSLRDLTASATIRLAQLARFAGNLDEAACWLDLGSALGTSPDAPRREICHDRAVIESELGLLASARGDRRGALEHAESAVRLLEELCSLEPDARSARIQLARALRIAGNQRSKLGLGVVEPLGRAADLLRELSIADPYDVDAQENLCDALLALGAGALDRRDYREASERLAELAGVAQHGLSIRPTDMDAMLHLVRARALQTSAELRAGTIVRALEIARDADALLHAYVPRIDASRKLAAVSSRIELAAQLGLQLVGTLDKSPTPDPEVRSAALSIARGQLEAAQAELAAHAPSPGERALHTRLGAHCTELLPKVARLAGLPGGG